MLSNARFYLKGSIVKFKPSFEMPEKPNMNEYDHDKYQE